MENERELKVDFSWALHVIASSLGKPNASEPLAHVVG